MTQDIATPYITERALFAATSKSTISCVSSNFLNYTDPMPPVYGQVLDAFTRCSHYHTDLDIVAIRFKCCNKYFPCYQCHDELRNHLTQRWTTSELEKDEPVILCGSCQQQLTFSQYIGGGSRCVYCDARFNPKCALHYDLYFDLCGPIGAAVEDCKEAVEERN